MSKPRRVSGPLRPVLIVAALALAAAAGGWAWHEATRLPKRFGVVEAGRLYRSGEVSPTQLENVVREKGVRTVLSLLDPSAPESVAELQAAQRLGLTWLNIPLRGDGSSTPEARDRIREVLLRDDTGPILVHCAAGSNRTGLACGMWRIHRDGWTVDQVLDEMRRYDFEDLEKHENLRAALRDERRLYDESRSTPAATQPAP
ncbi:MAG: hypothetical protein AMXMBFR47_34820 [Planctomycetota bacterium]